jgi:CHAT domain-containing protein
MRTLRPRHLLASGFALLAAGLAAGQVRAAPRDDFNLGRSAISGAVCEAVRDFDDPVALGAGRRAWQVRCRGWSQSLGRIYFLERDWQAAETAWRKSLAERADCDEASRKPLPKVAEATAVMCKSRPASASYVVYSAREGDDRILVAEGLSGVADVLATGLKVISGDAKPPAATAEQGGAGVTGEIESLNAVAEASGASVEKQKQDAYRQAQLWRFDEAEARFSSLAAVSADMSAAERSEAYLNVAMNASNAGRFAEADAYFKAAEPLIAQAHSQAVTALALNQRAAHARNARKFEEAIALARQANDLREAESTGNGVDIGRTDDGDVVIGLSAAAALNAQGRGLNIALGPHERALVREAQALQIIGTSQEALSREGQARTSLLEAAAVLETSWGGHRLGEYAPWLTARIQADIARLDRNRGDVGLAVRRLQTAIDSYSARYPGSLVTGHFLIELARARAADGEEDQALADFEAAFDIFRRKRGSLGPSADIAGAYFDILLHRIGQDPAAHPAEVQRFFDSSEALVGESTASAALQFAERLVSGDTAGAGLARARDATLRQIDDKLLELRQAQRTGVLTDERRTAIDAEVEALRVQANDLEQRMFAADPRYRSALKTDVPLSQLQASLRPGEAYAKILILANRGYGLLITGDTVTPYAIDLTRAQARTMAAQLRKPFDEVSSGRLGRYDVALARALYVKLFGPVTRQLKDVRTLIYQPDPMLVGVPIGALVTDDASLQVMRDAIQTAMRERTALSYRGVNWLANSVQTSISVSTAAFVNTRKVRASNAPQPFLGFADPLIDPASPRTFASVSAPAAWVAASGVDVCADVRRQLMLLPRLPETATEVRTVAAAVGAPQDVILGRDFTDDRVKRMGAADRLDQYRVLYFATHGLLPQANGCLQPSLVTSVGLDGGDSLLDVKEIPDLKLDADLVVLSACNTGQSGDDSGGGAALGGLAAAFTYAGARNLLVSNWMVDSAATELLMTTLFTSTAATQGAALQAAQRVLIDRPDAYSHPFYWASFSIVGDSARPMPKLVQPAVRQAQAPTATPAGL